MNLAEITAAVQALDHDPRINEARIGRWLAWPVVKPVLHFALIARFAGRPDSGGAADRRRLRWRRARWALAGLPALLAPGPWRGTPHLLAFTQARSRREMTPDGRHVDVHFDALLGSGTLPPAFVIEAAGDWDHPAPAAGPRQAYDEPLAFAAGALARALARGAAPRDAAARLAAIVAAHGLPLDAAWTRARFTAALAGFEARRRVTAALLARRAAHAVLLLDSDSMGGTIAAARERAIPVIELQHGIAGADHVGYQWAPELGTHRAAMAIPDRILVFGDLWRELFTRRGFWHADEIVPVGTARMERYWDAARARAGRPRAGPPRILFTTQWTCREAAIAFWNAALDHAAGARAPEFELLLKVHPGERRHEADYQAVAQRHPGRARVVPAADNTFQAMIEADIVASYHSTSLIEAAALGVPTVSIMGGAAAGGLAGATGIDGLRDDIVHVATPDALLDLLAARAGDTARLAAWEGEARARGARFFRPGFVANASAAIAEVIDP